MIFWSPLIWFSFWQRLTREQWEQAMWQAGYIRLL